MNGDGTVTDEIFYYCHFSISFCQPASPSVPFPPPLPPLLLPPSRRPPSVAGRCLFLVARCFFHLLPPLCLGKRRRGDGIRPTAVSSRVSFGSACGVILLHPTLNYPIHSPILQLLCPGILHYQLSLLVCQFPAETTPHITSYCPLTFAPCTHRGVVILTCT